MVKFESLMPLIVALIFLLHPLAAKAADGDLIWPYELEIENPEILLSDRAGGAVVVWSSGAIRAQRYDDEGNIMWGATGKAVSSSTSAAYPAGTEDMFGGIVVAFTSGANIYAQRLDEYGNKLWNNGNDVLVLAGVNPSEAPIITPDGAGGAYIGYRRKLNQVSKSGNVPDTAGYEFISAGADRFSMVYDGKRSLNTNTTPWSWIPGGVYLAWFSTQTQWIHAQHIDGVPQWGDTSSSMNGVIVATQFTHITLTGSRFVRVARTSDNALIVAWSGWDGYPTERGQIRAQRLIDPVGAAQWPFGGVVIADSETAGGDPLIWWQQLLPPVLASDGAGGAILAWTDMRNTDNYPGDLDIYCQRVNAAGNVQWPTNGVWVTWPGDTTGEDPPNSGTEKNPAMVSDGNGGVIIAVQDYYQTHNIFANRVNSDGSTRWTIWPVWDDYEGEYGNQTVPQIIFDNSGPMPTGAIVAWQGSGGSVGDSAQKIEISNSPPTNADGDFDGTDLAELANEFGSSCGSFCQADYTSDGMVDGADLLAFAEDFGKITTP
jgi:hypothetical protein